MNRRSLGFDVNPLGTAIFIVQVVFLALAWITFLIRAFVKVALLRKVQIDDYIMLLAVLGFTGNAYFVFISVLYGGLGQPSSALTKESIEISLKALFGDMALSGPVSGLARISIGLFLLRIALQKWHRLVLHTIIGTTAAMTTVYFFLVVFQCSPVSHFWDRVKGVAGSCDHSEVVQVATLVWGSFAVVMDWMLGLLPVSILWHLRINRRQKVGIAAILSFGIISGVALLVRLIFIKQTGPAFESSINATVAVAISATAELALLIMAGCIATFPTLFRKMGIHFGSGGKREVLTDTIPWQRSSAGLEPRHHRVENTIMMAPQRLESTLDVQKNNSGVRRARKSSPSAKRVLSSSNWDINVGVAETVDGGTMAPPRGKVQVYTSIDVFSQPFSGNPSLSTLNLADKPLPPPPPRPTIRDRSIPRSRPHTPNLFSDPAT